MDKLLTLVIPTYNMENYLSNCLNSLIIKDKELLDQVEVLVINDGSKDNSSQIAHEFEKEFPNTFVVVDKKNGNYGSCINCGLKMAKGKYIKVLDSDDSFDVANFESFLNSLLDIDVDLIISDYCVVDSKKKVRDIIKFDFVPNQIFDSDVFFKREISIQMHAVTYKTDNLKSINYTQSEGISYTDQEWMLMPMVTVKKVFYFNKIVYKYLIGRDGQTVDNKTYHIKVNERIVGAKKMLQDMNSIHYNDLYCDYLNGRMFSRLQNVYFSCLIVNRSATQLKDFDNILDTINPDLYSDLSNEKFGYIIKCNYIKKWRESNQIPSRYFYVIYIIQEYYADLKFFLKRSSFLRKVVSYIKIKLA